jgi:peptidyl-dipeptidase Dcp
MASHSEQNPFFKPLQTPHEAIPFRDVRLEHFRPAVDRGIETGKARLEAIRSNPAKADFANTVLALETATEELDLAAETFFVLLSAHGLEGMHELAREISPQLAAFSSDLYLDEKIFARVKAVHDSMDGAGLSAEQKRLVDKFYKAFVRNGAMLSVAAKTRLREIDQEAAKLQPAFSENVLKATQAYVLNVTDASKLAGIPELVLESAKQAATARGLSGWAFTLDAPSYIPFMDYCADRDLREQISKAFGARAFGGEFDNRGNVLGIAKLRHERAKLMGFATHAHFVLEERMAESPDKVKAFLERLLKASKPAGEREIRELSEFARSRGGPDRLQPWDFSFWAKKLKQERYSYDDEEVRRYFPLENVLEGAFEHARRLYGIVFHEVKDVPTWHPEVKVFEVSDEGSGNFIGLFYTDFFPRPTKKSGAWMTPVREQGLFGGRVRRPHVGIVCNFTRPTDTKPSLLTYGEVRTLFHEFGHALHGLLSDCTYRSVAGTNVYWDFVELPSQIMENWTVQKESLDLFARHFETGETIPAALAKKLKDSENFLAGYASLRQLGFAMLDLAWHAADPAGVDDVVAFEDGALAATRLMPKVEGTSVSCAFSHIFAGGYSAGYYSYKWAEVLDADAFELFLEKGLFNRDVGHAFRLNILSKGGTEHPMELYKKFRGREPDPDALLRRSGLI